MPAVLTVLVPGDRGAAGLLDEELRGEQRHGRRPQQRGHQPAKAQVEGERRHPRLRPRLRRLVQAEQPLRRHRRRTLGEHTLGICESSGDSLLGQELWQEHVALGLVLRSKLVDRQRGKGRAHNGRRGGLPHARGGVIAHLLKEALA